MTTLSVWKFTTADGAAKAEDTLLDLQKQELVTVLDGAVVSWEAGKRKPKTRQLHSVNAPAILGGAFWGLLFGLVFVIPLFGLAVGAAAGAITGSLNDVGIDDTFIETVRDQIEPGTSALFVLSEGAVLDKVAEAFDGSGAHLVQSNLSDVEEAKLRATFGDE